MRIALCAGEQSGDELGAGLIRALAERLPEARFVGVGGQAMRDAGQEQLFPAEELSVMGLAEVLRHLPRLWRRRQQLLAALRSDPPEVFIGIDAPDFNLGIERALKQAGIATVHYVSPSIWAWRAARARKIGLSADLVLCLFPFEPALYAAHGVDARFVGHPLAERFPMEPTPTAARAALRLPFDTRVLALLPGSRASEIERLAPIFLEVARRLRNEFPRLTAVLPAANAASERKLRGLLRPEHGVILLEGQAQLALQAADAVLVASGTAALEAALAKKPMLVCYRLSPLTYLAARWLKLVRTPWFSLPNQLAGHFLVPELVQHEVHPEAIVGHLLPWLRHGPQPTLIAAYRRIHESLARQASQLAAEAVLEGLQRSRAD